MRFILYPALFIFLASFAFPQKVSEKCAKQKLLCDSAMRVEYSDSFFRDYFVFDEESYVWADENHMCSWNEPMYGDTVLKYEINYYFRFPGARIERTTVYGPETDSRGRLVTDTMPYPGRCSIIGEHQMNLITQKYLDKPLSKCTVSLYPFYFYFTSDYGGPAYLDSSNIFLEVEYERYKGSGRRGTAFTSTTWTVVVNACTGEVLGPARKRVYSGMVGGKF